jgi:hypothetical protein
MPTLRADLDLSDALRDTMAIGAGFAPDALDDHFRRRLLAEIEDGPFEPLPERSGRNAVRQQADCFVVRADMCCYPLIRQLRDDLMSCLREQSTPQSGLPAWLPNQASVQRYAPGSLGVSPHLDGKRFHYLVAVFTLEGAASFALCTDRTGTVLHQWETLPASLVLMRGPGLAGSVDGRPLHTVRGPRQGHRTSLTYRMDSTVTRYPKGDGSSGCADRDRLAPGFALHVASGRQVPVVIQSQRDGKHGLWPTKHEVALRNEYPHAR